MLTLRETAPLTTHTHEPRLADLVCSCAFFGCAAGSEADSRCPLLMRTSFLPLLLLHSDVQPPPSFLLLTVDTLEPQIPALPRHRRQV